MPLPGPLVLLSILLLAYVAGTWGPSAAVALIERDGRTWYEDQDL